jgi:hypothetical protein
VATVLGYHLPAASHQGPSRWYTLQLRLLIHVARARGSCTISASTNSEAAAQVELTTSRRSTKVDVLDWIDGHRIWSTHASVISLVVSNYLQVNGVRPGANTLTVKVETFKGSCVSSAVALPGTGIQTTGARPDELRLLVPRQTIPSTIGHKVALPFELLRRGGRPDGPVTVAIAPSADFTIVGPRTMRFPRIGGGIRGKFEAIPKSADVGVSIYVPRRLNQPTAAFYLRPGPAAVPWYQSQTAEFAAASTCIVTASLLLLTGLGKRRSSSRKSRRLDPKPSEVI